VAAERVRAAGLTNVRIVHGMIEDFHDPFDVGGGGHTMLKTVQSGI
jgi:hypothetical protein